MKKIGVLLFICASLLYCKSDVKTGDESKNMDTVIDDKAMSQNDGLIAIQGEFIYYADAAVLKTSDKMYGVVIDDVMQELQSQVKTFKKEDTDMIPVIVRGRLFKKDPSEEGWEDKIEIKEILKVSSPSAEDNDVIKIGNK